MDSVLFITPGGLSVRTPNNTVDVCGRRRPASMCVSEESASKQDFKGFGDKPAAARPVSKGQKRRESAATKYDEMAAAGMPQYSVWIRLKDPPKMPDYDPEVDGTDDEPMPWLPVGSLSVPRSSQVSAAIYEAEDDLLQGAYRLYPNMKKEELSNIEYGFQNKEFPDEDIRLATPEGSGGIFSGLQDWIGKLTNPMNVA